MQLENDADLRIFLNRLIDITTEIQKTDAQLTGHIRQLIDLCREILELLKQKKGVIG